LECEIIYLIVANFMYLHRFNQVFFVIKKDESLTCFKKSFDKRKKIVLCLTFEKEGL